MSLRLQNLVLNCQRYKRGDAIKSYHFTSLFCGLGVTKAQLAQVKDVLCRNGQLEHVGNGVYRKPDSRSENLRKSWRTLTNRELEVDMYEQYSWRAL